MNIDAILYADDDLLLSNTKSELNTLLIIVAKFGVDLGMKFNPQKTQYIVFNENIRMNKKDTESYSNQANLLLGNQEIIKVDSESS